MGIRIKDTHRMLETQQIRKECAHFSGTDNQNSHGSLHSVVQHFDLLSD